MGLRAAIIVVGNELVSGDVQDTNARFLADFLTQVGAEVVRISDVRDVEQEICEELTTAVRAAQVVILTGGLGPTSDDLTRNALATFVGEPLELHPPSVERMKEMFARRNRPFLAINERQAYFPKSARVLPNPVGTADAFILKAKGASLISLPGVPREMEVLIEREVKPYLLNELHLTAEHAVRTVVFFGLPESQIGQSIESAQIDPQLTVAYRPVFPEVWVKLSARKPGATALVNTAAEKIVNAIGREHIVSENGLTLPQEVGRLLAERGLTVSTAESCSGGLVAERIVSVPGASKYFLGSVVSYSNQVKEQLLEVKASSIREHGAVSEVVATEMARNAREKFASDIAVSVTGVAGPDGGTPDKPVGTVCVGLATAKTQQAFRFFYPIDRNRFRAYSAALALDLIRRELMGYRLDWTV